ncbi:sensor histidine kinase [Streptomyces silvensis]|uniref:histidine kinase n=1 Tax=Streptomyces silvensis TaxID=1765722 RepID=A0A0W7X7P5_9ACTN|nr:histidine kinase [Streptomyces silvensis]KUF18785.1 histidine kinase [Streptomyces silvensis]
MDRLNDRYAPVLLLAVQAALWPGTALLAGRPPAATELLAAALVDGLATAALAARRRHPVPALVLVAAACATVAQALPVPAVAVIGTAGVALALHTVAAERDTPTALLSTGTLAAWQALHGLSLHGLGDRDGLALGATVLLYAAATATGMYVRRSRAARHAAEQRLHRARAERHRLPAAERRRMERELHDISAHHLTAVVVTVEAALELREKRPELAVEAAEFAAETGREVTRALSAVKTPAAHSPQEQPAPQDRLDDLVAGFRALGQPLTCDIQAPPDGTTADAAYGIIREALTNAVRHAFGTPTTVTCVYGDTHTEITVTNEPPPAVASVAADTPGASASASASPSASTSPSASAPARGLGGGRGQNLLRSRAREAGGTLTTGPTPEGGWRVHAVLPGRTGTGPAASAPRGHRLAQCVAAAGLCLQPLLPTVVIRDHATSAGADISVGVLFALLATAQATTLLWLRRAPRATFAALLTLGVLWPLATTAAPYTGPAVLPPALGALATCAALFAVAARTAADGPALALVPPGRSAPYETVRAVPRWTLPAAVAAVHAVTVAVVLLVRSSPAPGAVAAAGAGGALVTAAAWVLGTGHGRRRHRARATHEDSLTAWTHEAVRHAWAERRRITVGLETTVLARTAEVVEQAEAGHLPQTAERARHALTAMRALLDTVRNGEGNEGGNGPGVPGDSLRPQPTLQALDLLLHQYRATGRQVDVRITDRFPAALSPEVDLATYRAAEIILETCGDEPATLALDRTDDILTLTATGVPRATRPPARQRLATRAAALGGTLTTPRPDTVELRLPHTPSTHPAGVRTEEDPR